MQKVCQYPNDNDHCYQDLHCVEILQVPSMPNFYFRLAIVNNECVITIGKNLTKAFDRLEVTDYSARSIISACNIAQITPINDEQSAEI